jgi:hypothetical protein
MGFDLESYETVQVKRRRFWAEYPQGRILTEMVYQDERRFICKAEVYTDLEDLTPRTTGHAEEIVGAGPVNRTSALENCETSAVGRALSMFTFDGEIGKNPSQEEMQKVERYEKEPRKPRVQAVVYTPEEIQAIKGFIAQVENLNTLDELRLHWVANTAYLDVSINGTTLKTVINAKKDLIAERDNG